MRCGSCNRFVGFEEQEPEVNSVEIEGKTVTVEVRIVNVCSDCGEELKEAELTIEQECPGAAEHDGDGHELEAEEGSSERIQKSEGKGRGTRTFYGASIEVLVTCSCGKLEETVTLSEYVQASSMEQLS